MSENLESPNNEPIMVSACLLGIKCTYNCEIRKSEEVVKLAQRKILIPFCPEQLGGMKTPRVGMSIVEGSGEDVLDLETKVLNEENKDITSHFLMGAEESMKYVTLFKVKTAIMRDKSPSCGVYHIYNRKIGEEKYLVSGRGVSTAQLKRHGLKIISGNDNKEILEL